MYLPHPCIVPEDCHVSAFHPFWTSACGIRTPHHALLLCRTPSFLIIFFFREELWYSYLYPQDTLGEYFAKPAWYTLVFLCMNLTQGLSWRSNSVTVPSQSSYFFCRAVLSYISNNEHYIKWIFNVEISNSTMQRGKTWSYMSFQRVYFTHSLLWEEKKPSSWKKPPMVSQGLAGSEI